MAEAVLPAVARPVRLDFRFSCLILALLVYAVRGTPTPDAPGAAEVVIGLLLVAAVGPAGVMAAFAARVRHGWMRAGQLLLLYGVSVPVFVGLAAGNDAGFMARDMIAFLFLMMPLFYHDMLRLGAARIVIVTMAAVTVGLAFAWRVIYPVLLAQGGFDATLARLHPADPAYLANAPTVLFAALLLLGLAGLRLYVRPGMRAAMAAGALTLLAALPFVTMALILQRASIGLSAAVLLSLLLAAAVWRPYRAVPLLAAAGLAAVLAWPFLADVAAALTAKTATVGLNMRAQETAAVLGALAGDAGAVLWGRGWGAAVVSPAAGIAYPVNFTHSLLTTYWLKTGLCGVVLVVFYIGALARLLWPLLWARPVLAVALAVPLAIDVTLYASFKSLDFGIILLLIALWGGRAVSLHRGRVYSMSGSSPDH